MEAGAYDTVLPRGIAIETRAGKGRALIATQHFKAGEFILGCEPCAYVAHPQLNASRCAHCFGRAKKLRRCSACKRCYYCSVECQKKDWVQGHQLECKFWKRAELLPESVISDSKLPTSEPGDTVVNQSCDFQRFYFRVSGDVRRRLACMEKPSAAPGNISSIWFPMRSWLRSMNRGINKLLDARLAKSQLILVWCNVLKTRLTTCCCGSSATTLEFWIH